MLDRRSLLVAGASSLASIMLPRVPGSANAFILPFAPAEAYADEDDPFKVLVLSRTMFGVVVVDVANKNTPIRLIGQNVCPRWGHRRRSMPLFQPFKFRARF